MNKLELPPNFRDDYVYAQYVKKLQAEQDLIVRAVMTGVETFEEYKRLVGAYQGISTCFITLTDLLKQQYKEDEET